MQRILIADDDAAIRGVLRELLEDEGYDVAEVGNGPEVLLALSGSNGQRPDLVVMDVRMPDKSGIDVLREANNVFGGAVNIAARISALAAPGEVLVSRTVADLARTSAGVTFEDRGEHALKGIAEPQRVFAVRTSEGD